MGFGIMKQREVEELAWRAYILGWDKKTPSEFIEWLVEELNIWDKRNKLIELEIKSKEGL